MAAKAKFEIKNPDAPMSDRQCYALLTTTGVTFFDSEPEDRPFTKGETSDMLDAINNDGKAYHMRLKLAEAGGEAKRNDVHKKFRKGTKPRGYVAKMAEALGEEAPAPVKKAAAKNTKKPKVADKVKQAAKIMADFTDEERKATVLAAFGLQ